MSIPYTYSLYDASDKRAVVKEVKGIISYSDNELLFEFKVYNMQGSSTSNLNKFSIDIDQLKNVRFKKGFFRSNLIIEANKMAFLDPLPGSEQGLIKLKVKRANKNEAVNFSAKLNLILSKNILDEME
ncbi:MAG: hypothetical protein WD059_04225 [Balneolaceae bacterium]